VELIFDGVEWSWVRCLGMFSWSGAKFGGAECSQTPPKWAHPGV